MTLDLPVTLSRLRSETIEESRRAGTARSFMGIGSKLNQDDDHNRTLEESHGTWTAGPPEGEAPSLDKEPFLAARFAGLDNAVRVYWPHSPLIGAEKGGHMSISKRIIIVSVLLLLLWPLGVLGGQDLRGSDSRPPKEGVVLAEDGLLHGTGFLDLDPSKVKGLRRVEPSQFERVPLPAAVDNSAGLPPVKDQGAQNSCGAWSIGYYMKTYEEGRERKWSLTDPSHQFSPAFIFNQDYKGADAGSYWADGMLIMQTLGCATLATMPYDPANYTNWPTEAAYREAVQYRIGNYYRLDTTAAGAVDAIRQLIAAGRVGMGAIRIYENFRYISSYNYIFAIANTTGAPEGWHATTFVGYDDTKVTPDGVGAFRCVNSWGPNWGDAGFYWLSYQAVADANKTIWQGAYFYFDELIGYNSTHAARIKVSYPRFRALGLTLSNPADPSKAVKLFDLYAYYDDRTPDIAAPTAPFWVDLGPVAPTPNNMVTFEAQNLDPPNGKSGQIAGFDLVRLADSSTSNSSQVPKEIAANGAVSSVSAKFVFADPCTLTCAATVPATGTAGVAVPCQASATATNCTGNVTYAWAFGDGTNSAEQNPSKTYVAAGTYNWSFTASIGGVTCTKSGAIVISATPTCTLACTATAPAGGTVGLPSAFSSTATATGCTGNVTYAWAFGDGTTSSEQNASKTYGIAGTFNWTFTASAGGVTCKKNGSINIAPAGVTITEIEVNQALGNKKEGAAYLPASDFVAGKETAVRVYLSSAVPVDNKNKMQTVKVFRGDVEVATLEPSPSQAPAAVLTFQCPSRGACGNWQAGTYRFVANIGGVTSTRENLLFQDRKPLRALAVAVRGNYGGVIKVPDGKWKLGGDFLRSTYPISYEGYKWELGNELDLGDPIFDLTTDIGRFNVWQALGMLRPNECAAKPGMANCYDIVVGFIKEPIVIGDRMLQGYTYGSPANIVVNDDQDMPATVAHEVAHIFGIGDEYRGGSLRCSVNPPPPDYEGSDWVTNAPTKCTSSTAQQGPSGQGSLISGAKDRPFEVGGRGALGDMTSYMGSGGLQASYWTSYEIYGGLFKQLKPAASEAATMDEPARILEANGWLDTAADQLQRTPPWYSYETTTPLSPGEGPYRIQAEDAGGAVLAFQDFSIAAVAHTNPPTALDKAPFEVTVLFPEGTSRFRILRGETVMSEIPVSPGVPTVRSITVPVTSYTGPETISWEGFDPDGDGLWYDLEYSPTGLEDDYEVIIGGTTATQAVVDFSLLPGGNSKLRVTATDGINTGEMETGNIPVPFKAPEVFIEEPVSGSTFRSGEEVLLDGEAYDLQDEWLSGDSELSWGSSLDGPVGVGPTVYVDTLTPGEHVITLTATNSGGIAATQNVTITVTPACALTCAATASPDSGKAPLAVNFSATATPQDCSGEPSFAWDFGDGTVSSEQNPSHTYSAAGSFGWTLAVTWDSRTCYQAGAITVTSGGGIPGDCNGDGSVSIGEVQKAINMFLGAIPPDCGVDCNGNGQVSIGELQKVINGFLELASNC